MKKKAIFKKFLIFNISWGKNFIIVKIVLVIPWSEICYLMVTTLQSLSTMSTLQVIRKVLSANILKINSPVYYCKYDPVCYIPIAYM